jgi:hypothetical protein
MKVSSALSVKALMSKIHPPLPLNPRESQKLLSLLTSSFRQQLNQDGGETSTNHKPTDAHIRSILSSPLFALSRRKQSRSNPSTTSNRSNAGGISALEEIQDSLSRPMEYFQEQVAAGTATLSTAKHCLRAHYNNLTTFRSETARTTMQNSQAGATVLHWLWSSGLQPSEYLHDPLFMDNLIPFLVAEGRAKEVWRWFESLIGQKASRVSTLSASNMLNGIVRAQKFGPSHMKEINRQLHSFDHGLGILARYDFDTLASRQVMQRTASSILSSLHHLDRIDEVKVALFSRFCDTLQSWGGGMLAIHELNLKFAEKPNLSAILDYIKLLSPQIIQKRHPSWRRRLIDLSFTTTKMLLAENNHGEANFVLDFLQANFESELGIKHDRSQSNTKRSEKQAEEDINLSSLETLAIG